MRCCTSATTSTNIPTSSTATAPRSDASRRRTRNSSRCRNTASVTRSTRPIPDSQEIHRHHPFIVIWDDHEFANNSWWGGAENHTPATEGDWAIRRAAAIQAYYEWMPIREDLQTLTPRIYRTFRFGNLATLFMLDTRIVGRDQEVDRKDIAALASPARSLLGAAQENWLAREFAESVRNNTTWNVLGQQVMFAQQSAPGTVIPNADTWDGYQASRERLFDMIERIKVNNLAVLTGDIHSSWAYDLPRRPYDGYDKRTGKGSLGVEFAGTSISSPSSLGAGPDGAKQIAGIMGGPAASALRGRAVPRLFHPRSHQGSACRPTSTVSPRCRSGARRNGSRRDS